MTRMPGGCVDLRGFGWPLAPLERKLAWERDASQARLALASHAVQQCRQQARELDNEHGRHAACAASSLRQAVDPRVHLQALHYLAGLQARRRGVAEELCRLEGALECARQDCIRRDRRLETVLALRAVSMRACLRTVASRQHKEADLAWLAHQQGGRTGHGSVT